MLQIFFKNIKVFKAFKNKKNKDNAYIYSIKKTHTEQITKMSFTVLISLHFESLMIIF